VIFIIFLKSLLSVYVSILLFRTNKLIDIIMIIIFCCFDILIYICGVISQSKMTKEDKIFEAALSLFTTKGFHGTPTSEIAKTAGVANGTLFHYFKTKEVLVNSLYLKVKNEMVEESTIGVEKIESLKLKLEYLWSKTIHWAMTNPQKIFFIQQYMYSPYITSNTQEEVDKIKEAYINLIQAGIDSGEIKEIPLDLIYNIATQQLFGMIQYLVANPEKYHDSNFMNTAFNLFYDILKKK